MSRVKGKVSRIWHNLGADGSEYWVLSIDGQRYSTWDNNMISNVHEGDLVEFAFSPSGRYRNLTALNRLPAPPFTIANKVMISPESLRVVRMNCLRTAAEMLNEASLLYDQKSETVITVAKKLENFVLSSPETRRKKSNMVDKA